MATAEWKRRHWGAAGASVRDGVSIVNGVTGHSTT